MRDPMVVNKIYREFEYGIRAMEFGGLPMFY